jgi:hypothetical protein
MAPGSDMKVLATYKVTPPDGPSFFASEVLTPDHFFVMTTRKGDWARDDLFEPADLWFPEQQFSEWDVQKVATAAIAA